MLENKISDKKLKELEEKNIEELESLQRLIILLEDIKNIENSNLDYAKEILNEVKFKEFLIIGRIGNLFKIYFESYYETKIKQTQNLKKLINIMKLIFYSTPNNLDYEIINSNRNISNCSESGNSQKYLGKNDILEIINSISLLNKCNNEFNDNYKKIISKEIDNLKKMEKINDLNLLKGIKEEKYIFENRLEEICKNGTQSDELNNVKNLILNDNSDDQKYIIWTINYLNKFRSILSVVEEKVYNAFKIIFEVIFIKLNEKKLYQSLDLAIILIQTFSTKKGNENFLLEEEFKENKIFKNEEIWINLIIQKSKELYEKIEEESKECKDNKDKDNIDYIKENLEPILISYVFSMKDFNVDNAIKKKVLEHICKMEQFIKFNFNVNDLMVYSED
jgi:hypothetical protein